MKMQVYIGYDPREFDAFRVAAYTLTQTSGIIPHALDTERLRASGLYWRDVDARHGQFYDLPSQAPCSTDFATSRFLTPIICQSGWALFTDCDVVFIDNVLDMLDEIEPSKAVYVVKHKYFVQEETKMDGQKQTRYQRKNWSSVMLFNCDHPANRRLSLESVNRMAGRNLHQFYWLADSEIGELDPKWNWLVGVTDKPDDPGIAHFTLGGPWIDGWNQKPHDRIWTEAAEELGFWHSKTA